MSGDPVNPRYDGCSLREAFGDSPLAPYLGPMPSTAPEPARLHPDDIDLIARRVVELLKPEAVE